MDRRIEPPIWPPDESEIPEKNEIPEGRPISHRLDCGSSARRINRQPGSSPAPFGPSGPLASAVAPVGGGFQEKLGPKDNANDVARTLFARSRGQPDSFDQRITYPPFAGA
jgi:hypothetical protein